MSADPTFTFSGSLIDGPDISVVELAGIELSEEQEEELWSETNSRDLLLECPCLEEIEVSETDTPLYSDTYFRYEATSKEELGAQLKAAIEKTLNPKKRKRRG